MAVPWLLGAQIALGLKSYLDGKRDDRDRLQALLRDAELGDRNANLSVQDLPWVVGRVRTSGIASPWIAEDVENEVLVPARSQVRRRYGHRVVFLSRGPIVADDAGLRAWADDLPVPLVRAAGPVWGSRGWTTLAEAKQGDWVDLVGIGTPGTLKRRFDTLKTRMGALLPGAIPASGAGEIEYPSDADPVAVRLFDDLLGEVRRLVDSARFAFWQDRRLRLTPASLTRQVPLNEPAVQLRFADAARAWAFANVPGWTSTDRGQDIGWMLATFRFWTHDFGENEGGVQVVPWGRAPTIEAAVQGAGDLDGNAWKLLRWLAVEHRGFKSEDLEGVDEAIALGDQPTFRPPYSGDTLTARLEEVYGRGNLPSADVQRRVGNELNLRETGAENGARRFELNVEITADDINSGAAWEMAERAGQGKVVYVNGKLRFRPGEPRASVVTFGRGDLLGTGLELASSRTSSEAYNSIDSAIRQDRKRGWKASGVPRVQSDQLVERDGLRLRVGAAAPGQTSRSAAQRHAAHLLARDDYRRTRGSIRAKYAEPGDARGSLAPLDVASLGVADGMQIEVLASTITPFDATYAFRETDASVYAVQFRPPEIDDDPGGPGGGGPDLSLGRIAALFRGASAGRVCDLLMRPGADVTRIHVLATWRPTDPASTATAVVNEYFLAVPADQRGAEMPWITSVLMVPVTDPVTPATGREAPYVFAAADRELALEVTPWGAVVEGAAHVFLLNPSIVGSPVTVRGIEEQHTPTSDGAFVGWRVTARGVEIPAGSTLVFSWTAGGADGKQDDAWDEFGTSLDDNMHRIDISDGSINVVVRNTFKLEADQSTLSMAARYGVAGSYVYSESISIDLNRYAQPSDSMREVDDAPTTRGGFTGEVVYIEEN